MTYETILFERRGHTAMVTLNRPERLNAYNEQMHADLRNAWVEVNQDDDIWTVVVTGTGRAFCTGADMREASAHMSKGQLGAPRWEYNVDFLRMYNELSELRDRGLGIPRPQIGYPCKPLISAINGICCGDGLGFVYNSDFCICADDSTFFDPHVTVAISPPGIINLTRQVPRAMGFAVMMLGLDYRMPAQRAYELGLVTEIVPREQLLERALGLAEDINTWSAPLATRAAKAAFWTTFSEGYEASRPWGRIFEDHVRFQTEDAKEGRRAYQEGRQPQWENH
jgi:enoyl-CoA hydratase/carnithine racemase